MREIAFAYQAVDRWLERNHGLTIPGYLVLDEVLRRLEGGTKQTTMGDIAKALCWAPACVTNAVDRLERKGWIKRERSRLDRRAIHLVLVDAKQVVEVRRQLDNAMPDMGIENEEYLGDVVDYMSRGAKMAKAG